jgi:hypothetical protein
VIPGETMIDEDFKWMYHVLRPCGGLTWGQLLGTRPLPAPELTVQQKAGTRGVSSPTCFPGGWPP